MKERLPLVLNRTLGPSSIRVSNRAGMLEAIRRNSGISRAELAGVTRLTQPAVSAIVLELMEMGLVREAGLNRSESGRPRVRLEIVPDACYVVGVDLARSGIAASVVDLNGSLRHSLRVASTLNQPFDSTSARLVELLQRLLDEFGLERNRIVGIGIGAPGPLSTSTGVILSPPNFGGWRDVPVQQLVEEQFQLPVWIDNDANACALAEAWFGEGRTFDHFVYLAVGTGVGAGVVVNGDLHRGAHDMAGEAGHTTVDVNGPRCSCGNYGCLELYTSSTAVVAAAVKALQNGETSLIGDLVQGHWEMIDIYTVAKAARLGDALAIRLVEQLIRYLGAAVVNLVNLFDPDCVFLGRGVANATADLILDPIRAMVAERSFSVAAQQVQIRLATFGNDEPVLGAACLVLHKLFSEPERLLAPLANKVPVQGVQ